MTESGFTHIIRPHILIDPAKSGGGEQRPNFVILSLPQALERTEKPITLSGKVTETTNTGSVRILTDQGEIVVKPDKPLSIRTGEQVEIRLPKGEPPTTANIRTAPTPTSNSKISEPVYTAPVKLPAEISVKELIQNTEFVELKNIPPQQISKIIVPYLTQLKTSLPEFAYASPIVLNFETANTTQAAAPKLTPPPPSNITTQILPVPPLPAAPIAKVTEQEQILISTAQGLQEFLKSENTNELEKTKLQPLPLEIAPRSLLAGLISRPLLGEPLVIPNTAVPQTINSPADIPVPAHTFPAQNSLFQILAVHIPVLDQPTAETQSIPFLPLTDDTSAPISTTQTTTTQTFPPTTETQNLPASDITFPILQPNFGPIAEKIDTVQAIVIGYTPERNFPVLQFFRPETPKGETPLYVLEHPIRNLPLGTLIELKQVIIPEPLPTEITKTAQILSSSATLQNISLHAPDIWSTLQEIQTTLSQAAPQIAQTFNAILPQINNPPQLGPAVLFFLAAMRSGDITGWIGDKAAETLKRLGKGDLISRLGNDLSTITRLSADSASQEWRVTAIPLQMQNEIHKIIIHYKNDDRNQNQDEKKNGGGTRFLMNLNLSQIGPMQLDGLFQADKKCLDLMLRTQTAFSHPMQNEMKRLYAEALEETAYSGTLAFQNKPDQWVHITQRQQKGFSEKI